MVENVNEFPKDYFERVKIDYDSHEKIERPTLTFWKNVRMKVLKNKGALVGVIILSIIVFLALFAPALSSYSFKEQLKPLTSYSQLPPRIPVIEKIPVIGSYFDGVKDGTNLYIERGIENKYFFFGTDELGRDQWVRIWSGVRISIFIALLAAFIDFAVGVTYGGVSGYFGGTVDLVMQRIAEILAGIPGIVLIILFLLILQPGIVPIALSMAITGWIGMSRVVRAQVLKLKEQEFIMASKTLGSSNFKIILKHLLPNTVSQIVVVTMFTLPGAIFYEAFLAFIGLGLPAPQASLGVLVNDGFQTMFTSPFLLVIPAVIISLLMLSFNLLADALRDALDPKMKDN